ncbi:unnamed protein product, partial [Staurois parvus]
ISVPKAVTPSYTRAYPAALLRHVVFTYLTLRSTMCPLQRPRPSPPNDAGIRLLCPVPVTSGRTGAAAASGGKFKNFKKNHFFFFLHFSYALSCALPAFCLFFL